MIVTFNAQFVLSQPATITVPDDFSTIQEAVDEANPGDTVYVRAGTYYENVLIGKDNLTLTGENKETTIIDGGGSTVVSVSVSDNVEISRFTIQNGDNGIQFYNTSYSTISGNIITNSTSTGVFFQDFCNYNTVSQNTVTDNNGSGMWMSRSSNLNVSGNNVTNNGGIGIFLLWSQNNVLTDNNMTDNNTNFGVICGQNGYSLQDIDTSNTVDGKAVYYLINQNGLTIDSTTFPNVGFLALVNSTNIAVGNLSLTNNFNGMICHNLVNSVIENVSMTDNAYGLIVSGNCSETVARNNIITGNTIFSGVSVGELTSRFTLQGNTISNYTTGIDVAGPNNTFVENTVTNNNGDAIHVRDSYTLVSGNNVTYNGESGILVDGSNNNISGNTITDNNADGLAIHGSSGNTVYGNTIANNNVDGIFFVESSHNTISENTITNNAVNGITLHRYSDDNTVSGNTITGNDCGVIVDISSNNLVLGNNMTFNDMGIFLNNAANNTTISGNIIANSAFDGILFQAHSINNTVIGNTVNDNNWDGVNIQNSSDNFVLSNSITGNQIGVNIFASSNSNTVSGNIITNSTNAGIFLYFSSYNTVLGNNIANNTNNGVQLFNSSTNTVSENIIASNTGNGIYAEGSDSNVVSGNTVTNSTSNGAHFVSSSYNTVLENALKYNFAGIGVRGYSNNNFLSGNNIANGLSGFSIYYSSHNTLSGNNVTDTFLGVTISSSSNNSLSNNAMSNNFRNLGISGENISDFIHDIDVSNTVDGKPVYYWVNMHDLTVPTDAGYVGLVNCTEITVENVNITNNGQGILLVHTDDSVVQNNVLATNIQGVFMRFSNSNTVSGNKIIDNLHGINPTGSFFNTFSGNNVTDSYFYGVSLNASSNNQFYHNNFIDNPTQIHTIDSINTWDDGYPSGGNYWSDYADIDVYSGPYQNETGSDNIWDTPYVIDAENQDNYPLVEPWTAPTPEQAIQQLIDDVKAMNLHHGIENSLIKKLEHALSFLEANRTHNAVNKLNAFINQVEAQRGKKITNEQADYLVSEAQKIINLISE
ncbi:MAG: right-handed parallel beta-helix repeat-containing protein [Candidatus Bathyarchaeota archaeon]|nr:right-handed parallel beta-helix repeat-containing protein [Candidatus Bathyarchaeota archaeon]